MASLIQSMFCGGSGGSLHVERMVAVRGEPLPAVTALERYDGGLQPPADTTGWVWTLRGTTSHQRYTERGEANALAAIQEPLGRAGASCAALIPIRKVAAWWDLAQDERRAILEDRSRHIAIGMRYLPAIARRLYHSRELGEPFDFLTVFEYAPADAARFDDLLGELRASEEWRYVEREVEMRLQIMAAAR